MKGSTRYQRPYGTMAEVDSAAVNSKDDQYSSNKNEHEEGNTIVASHINVSDKPEQDLGTVVVDLHVDFPSESEQSSGTLVTEAHIVGPSETNICINDLKSMKEDLAAVSIDDTLSDDPFDIKQNHDCCDDGTFNVATTTSSLPHVIVSSPLMKTAAPKGKNTFASKNKNTLSDDGHKFIASNLKNVASVGSKQNVQNILPGNAQSISSPAISSKLHNVAQDNASGNNKVKIKKMGSVVVRTIAPRTIRNVSANFSPSKTGVYVDPSGTILITREMDDGRSRSPVKARIIPSLQNPTVNKLLSCTPSQNNLQVNEHHVQRNSDGRPSASQGNFVEKLPMHSSCSDEVLISRQLDDELADVQDNIATEKSEIAREISKRITSCDTMGQVDNMYKDVPVGSDQSCCFCKRALARVERITYVALNKPLPSSLLDPISLLQCLGISSPLAANGTSMNNSTIILCQQCYTLVSDGDALYQQLLSVTSQMRELWAKSNGNILTVPVGSNCNEEALKVNQALQGLENVQTLQPSLKAPRKCRPTVPKPSLTKGSLPVPNSTTEKVMKVRVKQELSNNKMRICGFCGMDLYGEEDWNLHQAAVHRIELKWRWFNLQPTLKTLLAKEIQQSNVRQREDKTSNRKHDKKNVCKCTACSKNFSLRDELVEHLRHYHNMVIDEEFLSYISENWSADNETNIVENPVHIKSERMWDEHERVSLGNDMVHNGSIHDGDTMACEGIGKQMTTDNIKEEGIHTNTEDHALPAPNDCHNYLGANGDKETFIFKTESSKNNQNLELHCRVCGKLCSDQISLDKHKELEHSRSFRTSRKVVKENNLQISVGSVHSLPKNLRARTKVTCKLCNQICESQEDLNCHIDNCHENSVVILEEDGCGGVIDRRLEMSKALSSDIEHVQKETEVLEPQVNVPKRPDKSRSFMCNSCGETFVNRLLLVRHKRSAHGDLCGIGGANGLVMVECELCGRRLHGIGSLRLHMSKIHNRSQKPTLKHRCKMCIYHSRTRNQLEKHMQEKHGLNVLPPVECKDCGKMYSAKYIDIHIANMHENQKKFSCNFCSMKFNVKSSLKCHISYEHANNKWSCDKCHVEFEKYHQLRQHKIYVHSTKTFPCPQCGKTFKRKSDMTEHGKRRHQEKIPSECNYCTKSYADRKKLRTHLIKKHGVAWEDTLSKSYARHQRENNCLRKRQPRNSRTSQNVSYNEETDSIEIQEGIEIQQSQYELEHNGQQVHYEREQQGESLYEEQYQDGDPHQNYSEQHCTQLEEGTITTYEGANIGTLEDQQEYNVVQVTEGSENITNMSNISYIILEETQ